MKGFIFKNAYFNIEEYETQAQRLQEELQKLGVECDVIRNDYCTLTVDGNISTPFDDYDFCIYLDKDKYPLYAFEKSGIRTFNGFEPIVLCDDKMATFLKLSNIGVNMPTTIPGVLCYDPSVKTGEEKIKKIEDALGYPLIAKRCYGSRGNGVYMVKNRQELLKKADELKTSPHLFQRFIKESKGRDLRIIVIGGKVVGGMLRQSGSDDFRSNVALGGKAAPHPVNEEIKALCEKCASALNLDYCGIDVLLGKDGKPYVCEVNSNAFFYGFERVTGINVAKLYAEHIVNSVNKNRNRN